MKIIGIKNLLKNILQTSLMALAILAALIVTVPANAQTATDVINKIGDTSKLPSFDAGHSKQAYQAGASNITSAIYFTLDFLKYILGSIAVLMIVISGVRLVTAGKKIDDVYPKQKENLKFAIIGLVLIIVADGLVRQVFFGEEGEIYRSGTDLQAAAERGAQQLKGLYSLIQVFIGSLAVLFFVLAGFRLIASTGDPEQLNKAKKQMIWAVIGIILAGLSELVVKDIIFPNEGSRLSDLDRAKQLIVTLTNFASGFIATIAVTMLIYAGYLYVISMGGDDTGKAKKVVMEAVVGLLIAMAAFGLVNTFIKVEPLTNTQSTPTQQLPIP